MYITRHINERCSLNLSPMLVLYVYHHLVHITCYTDINSSSNCTYTTATTTSFIHHMPERKSIKEPSNGHRASERRERKRLQINKIAKQPEALIITN